MAAGQRWPWLIRCFGRVLNIGIWVGVGVWGGELSFVVVVYLCLFRRLDYSNIPRLVCAAMSWEA